MNSQSEAGPIPLTDDDGTTKELEHLDTVELNGELYLAFLPADMDEDDEDYGLVILKRVVRGEEEHLATIDDEDELEAAHELFIERLSDEEEV